MQIFREIIAKNIGMRFLYDSIEMNSSLGRVLLLNSPFEKDIDKLTCEFENIEILVELLKNESYSLNFNKIKHELFQIHNILNTLARLEDGAVLDDIELFEVKKTALSLQQIRAQWEHLPLNDQFYFLDMSEIISLLDPEGNRLPHFYIYTCYDSRLAHLRAVLESAQTEEERINAQLNCVAVEDEVRKKLSEQLIRYARSLRGNLELSAYLDLLIAKAELAIRWNCTRPIISESQLSFVGLENPLVKDRLVKAGKSFQPIDIELKQQPVLITGSNMSGKTVFLKSVALAQLMFQYGFFVPAQNAEMALVDEVLTSIGDQQSEVSGLSSYCVEILTINHIIKEAKSGKKLLVLVDELARTTNPSEGKALVAAFVRLLSDYHLFTIVTTHYDIHEVNCRRLRVKGLDVSRIREKLTPYNINMYMDYALEETDEVTVPTEALNIAKIFRVDEEFLQIASSLYAISDSLKSPQ